MSACNKSHLFAEGTPSCFREATQELIIEITLGPSKGAFTTAKACDSCATMLRRTRGLSILSEAPITPDPVVEDEELPPPARDCDEDALRHSDLIAEWDSVDPDFRVSVRRSRSGEIQVHDGNRVIDADYARAHARELLAAADRADREAGKRIARVSHLQNVLTGTVHGTSIQAADIHGDLHL